MRARRARTWLIVLACAGMPLVTVGTCDPETGAVNFYSSDYDDDHFYYYDRHDHGYFDHYEYDWVDCLLFPFLCL